MRITGLGSGYHIFQLWTGAQATFRAPGTNPNDNITASKCTQLDLLLTAQVYLGRVLDVSSDRSEVLASHYFLVIAKIADGAVPVPRQ